VADDLQETRGADVKVTVKKLRPGHIEAEFRSYIDAIESCGSRVPLANILEMRMSFYAGFAAAAGATDALVRAANLHPDPDRAVAYFESGMDVIRDDLQKFNAEVADLARRRGSKTVRIRPGDGIQPEGSDA
jgi:hypothetical protein